MDLAEETLRGLDFLRETRLRHKKRLHTPVVDLHNMMRARCSAWSHQDFLSPSLLRPQKPRETEVPS